MLWYLCQLCQILNQLHADHLNAAQPILGVIFSLLVVSALLVRLRVA
jgi:hypothetical protein